MRASLCESYGPPEVIRIREVPDPRPQADEVLVAVHATTVNSADARIRAMRVPRGFATLGRLALGVTRPRQPILGVELSGVVVAIGRRVTRFAVGDEVIAVTNTRMGAHAELCAVPESAAMITKPKNLSFAHGAALSFGGTTVLDYFRRAALASRERILIHGATGAVGSAAIQIGKCRGAHVTAVCSGQNADLARSLGADAVIDYRADDFAQSGETYDVVMDNVGTAPWARSRAVLRRGGRLLAVVATLGQIVSSTWAGRSSGRKVIAGPPKVRRDDLSELVALVERGEFTPLIDVMLSFDAIADAHARVDTGHKRGSVVIAMHD